MKRILIIPMLLLCALTCRAQEEVTDMMMLPEFQTATIYLSTGRKIQVPHANIFLKNGALLYKSGEKTKQANMDTTEAVDFGSRHFQKIDGKLAELLYSVDGNQLFDISLIDIEAYNAQIRNANVITNLSLDENVGITAVEMLPADKQAMPLIHRYYYRVDDRIIEVHERTLKRYLNKEQRQRMKIQMSLPDFSWTSVEALERLLREISKR